MSKTEQHTNSKDIFTVYQQNVDKYFKGIKQSVPQYLQSVTNMQQEYLQACENVVNSTITLQKECTRKAGITTKVPDATLKLINDTTEEAIKATTVQKQFAISTIDAAHQNIRKFNDSAKAYADLNKNVLQSWISTFTPRNN